VGFFPAVDSDQSLFRPSSVRSRLHRLRGPQGRCSHTRRFRRPIELHVVQDSTSSPRVRGRKLSKAVGELSYELSNRRARERHSLQVFVRAGIDRERISSRMFAPPHQEHTFTPGRARSRRMTRSRVRKTNAQIEDSERGRPPRGRGPSWPAPPPRAEGPKLTAPGSPAPHNSQCIRRRRLPVVRSYIHHPNRSRKRHLTELPRSQ
jgi:hypothetical protein